MYTWRDIFPRGSDDWAKHLRRAEALPHGEDLAASAERVVGGLSQDLAFRNVLRERAAVLFTLRAGTVQPTHVLVPLIDVICQFGGTESSGLLKAIFSRESSPSRLAELARLGYKLVISMGYEVERLNPELKRRANARSQKLSENEHRALAVLARKEVYPPFTDEQDNDQACVEGLIGPPSGAAEDQMAKWASHAAGVLRNARNEQAHAGKPGEPHHDHIKEHATQLTPHVIALLIRTAIGFAGWQQTHVPLPDPDAWRPLPKKTPPNTRAAIHVWAAFATATLVVTLVSTGVIDFDEDSAAGAVTAPDLTLAAGTKETKDRRKLVADLEKARSEPRYVRPLRLVGKDGAEVAVRDVQERLAGGDLTRTAIIVRPGLGDVASTAKELETFAASRGFATTRATTPNDVTELANASPDDRDRFVVCVVGGADVSKFLEELKWVTPKFPGLRWVLVAQKKVGLRVGMELDGLYEVPALSVEETIEYVAKMHLAGQATDLARRFWQWVGFWWWVASAGLDEARTENGQRTYAQMSTFRNIDIVWDLFKSGPNAIPLSLAPRLRRGPLSPVAGVVALLDLHMSGRSPRGPALR